MKIALLSNYLYIIGTIVFTIGSQLIIKWKMSTKYSEIPDSIQEKIVFFFKVLIDPFIILSVVLVFFSAICWMIAMTKLELSSTYPIVVAGLMIGTSISAILLFNEVINLYKLIGITIILFGVYILYKGNV